MAFPVGTVVFWTVLASTPIALWLFVPSRWPGGHTANFLRLLRDYFWHWALLGAIVLEKTWVDGLNGAVRSSFGDQTWIIHRLEGDAAYWVQHAFMNKALTFVLSIHYLWVFVFMNYFTTMWAAYRDDRELANLAALNYTVIYLLAVPFYIFFNIQITSDAIPGMHSLLYHSGPGFYAFFLSHDPLDNAFPSLHIAIPFGFVLVSWWTMRKRGYSIRDWEMRGYLWFLIGNVAVFCFSIIYLGIHWFTDIPGGLLVGLLGATIAEELHLEFFEPLRRAQARTENWFLHRTRRAAVQD